MGLSFFDLGYMTQHKELLELNECRRVLDIGLQELRCYGDTEHIRDFIHALSPDSTIGREAVAPLSSHCFLYDVFELTDTEYVCYEVDGKRPFTFFDLNYDSVAEADKGGFDLVLNYGTSEHVMNQLNFYQTMHDACNVGGCMIHAIPFTGLTNHGFFNTNPKFFINLAANNKYEVLDMHVTVHPEDNALDDYIIEYLNQDSAFLKWGQQNGIALLHDRFHAAASMLRVILRKTDPGPFSPAIDVEDFNRNVFLSSTGRVVSSSDVLLSSLLEVPQKSIAIMPAGGELENFAASVIHFADDVGVIYDNDPKKDGTILHGAPVKQLPENPDDLAELPSVIILCSKAYEDDLKEQLKPYRDRGVRVLKKSEIKLKGYVWR